jgi:dTDP-4-amino-4,6-dideoxygalactose transaminase
MSQFQGSRGVIELSKVGENVVSREQLAGLYNRLLRDSGLKPVTIPSGTKPVLLRYPLLVKNKPAVLAEAQRRAVEIGSWFDSPLHPEGSPLEQLGYLPGQCPVAERVVQHMVNLPLHRRVSEQEAIRVVNFIKEMRGRAYV